MNTDFLTGVAVGLFIAGLIWLCFDIRAKNRKLDRDLRELRVDDEFDSTKSYQDWLKKTYGVPQ